MTTATTSHAIKSSIKARLMMFRANVASTPKCLTMTIDWGLQTMLRGVRPFRAKLHVHPTYGNGNKRYATEPSKPSTVL